MPTNLLVPAAILACVACLLYCTRRPPVAAKSTRQAVPGLAAIGQILNDLLKRIQIFLESLPAPADPDLENSRQVYGHVVDLLAEQLGCQPEAARALVHCLCGEQDKALVADDNPCDPALLQQASRSLIEVNLQYLLPDSRQAQRVTIITFLTDGGIGNRRIMKEMLPWEQLPSAVRDARLRHGATQLAFQLYPPSGDAANS
jgi:hypothetical protein